MQDTNDLNDWFEEAIKTEYLQYYDFKHFSDIQYIGSGYFGEVVRANWRNLKYFALKSFKSDKQVEKEIIINEIKLHRKVDYSDNIIRFHGITIDNQVKYNVPVKKYLLVLEYADGGSLRSYLEKNFKTFTWNDKYNLAYQLACAISCLHAEGIVHRDLHSSNVLVHENIIKLADFGLSKSIDKGSKLLSKAFGSIPYVDPEGNTYDNHIISRALYDVFSLGVLLWEISSGHRPFKNRTYDQFLAKDIANGHRETIVPGTPIDYSNLYTECWNSKNIKPSINRPTSSQVVERLKEIISKTNPVSIDNSNNNIVAEQSLYEQQSNANVVETYSSSLQMSASQFEKKRSNLSLESDGLKVINKAPDESDTKSNVEHVAAAIRANNPIPSQFKLFYFEVYIMDKGKNGAIGIGFCSKAVDLNNMPGWKNNSWGYYSDNGNFFDCSTNGKSYGPLFTTGDTIGCCVNFLSNMIFYTKNGIHLGIAFQKDLKEALYLCIGKTSQDGSVEVNFGHKKFKYAVMNDDDIDEVLKKKWINLNLCNDELISQQTDRLTDLAKSLEKQNIVHALRYQGKFYFVMCKYEQALKYLTKLLELKPNDLFALRYRGEIYHIMKKYEESLVDLDNLLEISTNETSPLDLKKLSETNSNISDIAWILNTYEEVARNQCKECNQQYYYPKWCQQCNSKHFQNYFKKWTSKNIEIDEILQKVQFDADSPYKVMEWIPYNRLIVKKYINEGGFGTIYLANWLDGAIYNWNINYQKWNRNTYQPVALKILKNSSNLSFNLLKKEVKPFIQIADKSFFIQCLGFSQDPKTSNYIIVMEFAPLGSLYTYLNNNMTWDDRIVALLDISIGLKDLHDCDIIHQNFHPGNLLFNDKKALLITDFGLCNPVKQSLQSNDIYGVMPYVAPEVLKAKPYTKAGDIYSFGMIMYFVATGKQPFTNCAHDHNLAIQICNGIRPEINKQEVPEFYINLMKKCWDSNRNRRPNASEIEELIRKFYKYNYDEEINKQFKKAEEYRKANPLSIENNQHPQAIYTSRLLNPFTKDLLNYTE